MPIDNRKRERERGRERERQTDRQTEAERERERERERGKRKLETGCEIASSDISVIVRFPRTIVIQRRVMRLRQKRGNEMSRTCIAIVFHSIVVVKAMNKRPVIPVAPGRRRFVTLSSVMP